MKSYYLPVGYSEVTRQMVERHDDEQLEGMLRGRGVLVLAKKKDFALEWGRVLAKLGANVMQAEK